jgi:hypothetical protein
VKSIKLYEIPELKLMILDNDPIVYGGKIYHTELSILMEELDNHPDQLAALFKLKKSEN